MALADVSSMLDSNSLVTILMGALGGPLSQLQGLEMPTSTEELEAAGQPAAGINVDAVGAAAGGVLQLLEPLASELPGAAEIIAPVETSIRLVETLASNDLRAELQSLVERAGRDLERREGPFLDVLMRALQLPGSSSKLQEVLTLLTSALRTAGVDLRPAQGFAPLLPGFANAAKGVGGLMALDTLLADSERLSAIMQRQLDPAKIEEQLFDVRSTFAAEREALARYLERIAASTPEEAEAVAAGLVDHQARLEAFASTVALGMGFGEATLVELDPAALEQNVTLVSRRLREADMNAVREGAAVLASKLAPISRANLGDPAADGLDALLVWLEGQVAGLGTQIRDIDLAAVTEPLQNGLGQVLGALRSVSEGLESVVQTVRTALEQVRSALAAIPLDELIGAIREVLSVVTTVLNAISELVDRVGAALDEVARTATSAIRDVEHAIVVFKAEVDNLLRTAADFVVGLDLDGKIGQVTDAVRSFAETLGSVQMEAYFATAGDVIGSTADIVSALPLDLLPDSTKTELEQAAAPIRAINLPALEREVEGWFQIRDGKFVLREPLEEAVSGIQEQIESLIAEVERVDPRLAIDDINRELGRVSQTLLELSPTLLLTPVRESVDDVRGMLEAFDLRATLQPLSDAFEQVLSLVNEYSPVTLIEPLEERLAEARRTVIRAVALDQWRPRLDELAALAGAQLERLDPSRLEPLLAAGYAEARAVLNQLGDFSPLSMLGDFVSSLASDESLRVRPESLNVVIGWLDQTRSGTEQLAQRAARVADAIEATHAMVAAVDLPALSLELDGHVQAYRALIAAVPSDDPLRVPFERALRRLTPAQTLAELEANRSRYLGLLGEGVRHLTAIRAVGFSQADVHVNAQRAAMEPLRPLYDLGQRLLGQIGLRGLGGGLRGLLDHVFATASPGRIVAIVNPILAALREHVVELLNVILVPVRNGIATLEELVNALSLQPLVDAIQGIVDEVVEQLSQLNPVEILAPQLEAFETTQATLAAFDPLGALFEVLEELEAAIQRVLAKARGEELLAEPIRIYDEILSALRALRTDELVSPILDALDEIAQQIDDGLGVTTAALVRLQGALPGGASGGAGTGAAQLGAEAGGSA